VQRFQAVVVGAGPAGLVAANLLGEAGIRTLLIERNDALSGIPKALMVDDEFFRLLHKIKLGDALRAHGVGPVSYDYVSLLGFTVVHNAGRVTRNGFPSRTATFQPHFEQILFEGVRRFPSVEVRFATELTSLEQDRETVSLRLMSGGQETEVAADYVLAADGSHSACRKSLGVPFEELVAFGQRHIVVDVRDDNDRSLTARICMGVRRVYSSLPSPNGGRRYEFSLRPDEEADAALADDNLAKLFRRFAPYERLNVIRKAVYTFHSRLAKELRVGRVFLLGDAAHVMPIFGSQGMNSGARDAHNLTWKLARVLRGQSDPDLLDTYHDERHSQVAETIRVASTNGKLQSSTYLPMVIVRDIVIKAMTFIPSIHRYFAEMRYIPKQLLRTGIVCHDAARKQASMVGRLLPVPEVRTGAATQLLDDVIGPGWALVGVDLAPAARSAGDDPLWRELGATRTTVAASGRVADAVTQDGRFDEVFAAHAGEWLVVRPDRIIAAAARPQHLGNIASQLGLLLLPARAPATSAAKQRGYDYA
jgi:3-(3-hydroxy-phenyl)propionate hydroxylase